VPPWDWRRSPDDRFRATFLLGWITADKLLVGGRLTSASIGLLNLYLSGTCAFFVSARSRIRVTRVQARLAKRAKSDRLLTDDIERVKRSGEAAVAFARQALKLRAARKRH
jgi:hypothetical protein